MMVKKTAKKIEIVNLELNFVQPMAFAKRSKVGKDLVLQGIRDTVLE